ncbi:hypothetical protein NCAS_0C02160 [Naumovozyma castellii]|uniref:Uncharacterized protein n=1 Tax=Naumovozyma castellii TaxID=27288 RepID=G0VCJ6_NAUCA|nr:hypothetical protein NCAS_0C02160 [Naumovozyma castellii CBS 4309]CCC69206.1 hypothetical protein NCAS_0C02160 [Naumovozyma castellii CBS 4309]
MSAVQRLFLQRALNTASHSPATRTRISNIYMVYLAAGLTLPFLLPAAETSSLKHSKGNVKGRFNPRYFF